MIAAKLAVVIAFIVMAGWHPGLLKKLKVVKTFI
jgi:hypothetical protein